MRTGRILALLCAFFGVAANAQEGIYVGLGLGKFDFQENFTDALLGQVGDEVGTYKIFGGFEINDYFALEIDYGATSDITESVMGNFPPIGNLDYTLNQEFTLTTLKAVGQYPMEWGALLGGLGYFSSENDYTESGNAECCGLIAEDGTIRDEGLAAMLGVEWRFGRFGTRYGIRLEYTWRDIDLVDASTAGLAFSYGF